MYWSLKRDVYLYFALMGCWLRCIDLNREREDNCVKGERTSWMFDPTVKLRNERLTRIAEIRKRHQRERDRFPDFNIVNDTPPPPDFEPTELSLFDSSTWSTLGSSEDPAVHLTVAASKNGAADSQPTVCDATFLVSEGTGNSGESGLNVAYIVGSESEMETAADVSIFEARHVGNPAVMQVTFSESSISTSSDVSVTQNQTVTNVSEKARNVKSGSGSHRKTLISFKTPARLNKWLPTMRKNVSQLHEEHKYKRHPKTSTPKGSPAVREKSTCTLFAAEQVTAAIPELLIRTASLGAIACYKSSLSDQETPIRKGNSDCSSHSSSLFRPEVSLHPLPLISTAQLIQTKASKCDDSESSQQDLVRSPLPSACDVGQMMCETKALSAAPVKHSRRPLQGRTNAAPKPAKLDFDDNCDTCGTQPEITPINSLKGGIEEKEQYVPELVFDLTGTQVARSRTTTPTVLGTAKGHTKRRKQRTLELAFDTTEARISLSKRRHCTTEL